MNYRAHYDRLISRARDRILTGYVERHHVIPRCLGGSDESGNLVDLTPEEHFVAHQLLVKIHPGEHGLATAAIYMTRPITGNKAYGWLRRRHAAAVSFMMRGNKSWTGRKHTEQWKADRRADMLGRKMPRDGVEKMAASKRGKPLTEERRKKISASNSGRKRSAETRAKIAAAKRGKPISYEHGQKIAAANRARIYTPEMRAKRSASRRAFIARQKAASE